MKKLALALGIISSAALLSQSPFGLATAAQAGEQVIQSVNPEKLKANKKTSLNLYMPT